jgi:hypothetical protein
VITFGTGGDWWFALYDSTKTLIAQTADQGATAWGANSNKTLALVGGPFTISSAQAGWGYVAVMVNSGTGGTQNNFKGVGSGFLNTAISGGIGTQNTVAATNGSGLTTTAPTGPLALTTGTVAFYAILS